MAASVEFTVVHHFDHPSRVVWDELVDWKGHEAWIPMTTVELGTEPQDQVGATFVAFTGVWKLGLPDRMRVTQLDWDDATSSGTCEVEKLGPVLRGRAGFTVGPDPEGAPGTTRVEWIEDVTVKATPGFAAPLAAKVGAAGFKQGMKRLARLLDSRR
ncbi:MAG: SRPBCC family protein [Actinomycetota bacterium]